MDLVQRTRVFEWGAIALGTAHDMSVLSLSQISIREKRLLVLFVVTTKFLRVETPYGPFRIL